MARDSRLGIGNTTTAHQRAEGGGGNDSSFATSFHTQCTCASRMSALRRGRRSHAANDAARLARETRLRAKQVARA